MWSWWTSKAERRQKETRTEIDQILTSLADRLRDDSLDEVIILLVGPAGAGKSTFINNCLSAMDNCHLNTAPTGDAQTITQRPIPYYLDVKGLQSKVMLLDSKGYHLNVTTKIVDQTITGEHQILQLYPEDVNPVPDDENPVEIKISDPKTATIILFVFSQKWVSIFEKKSDDALDEITKDQMEKMKKTRDNVRKAGIPSFVLLTRIDEVDPKIEQDILGYRSTRLDEKTHYLKKLFDIVNIFPVWNITDNKLDVDDFQRCHILRILNQIIVNALKAHKNCQRIRKEMEKNKKK